LIGVAYSYASLLGDDVTAAAVVTACARFAHIALAVAICILLSGVEIVRTIVARVAHTVSVSVCLIEVMMVGTIIASIARTIRLFIFLQGVGHARTVVAIVANSISVAIGSGSESGWKNPVLRQLVFF
jgi:hypothetical protein